jgi:hypothetical protein
MHRVSPDLSARKAERLRAAANQVVVDPLDEWTCAGFGHQRRRPAPDAGRRTALPALQRLDHLVFLPANDATRTGRAHRAGSLTAVVARFSQTRKRYERRRLLV